MLLIISDRCLQVSLVSRTICSVLVALMVIPHVTLTPHQEGGPVAVDSSQGCVRLQDGGSCGWGRKFSIMPIPLATSMRHVAPVWAEKCGAETLEVDGTRYCYCEHREPVELRKLGGIAEPINKCGDDERKLMQCLDDARVVLDCCKRRGRLPAWVADEGTPEIKMQNEQAKRARVTSTEGGLTSAWLNSKHGSDAAAAAASAEAGWATSKRKELGGAAMHVSGVAERSDKDDEECADSSASSNIVRESEEGTQHTGGSASFRRQARHCRSKSDSSHARQCRMLAVHVHDIDVEENWTEVVKVDALAAVRGGEDKEGWGDEDGESGSVSALCERAEEALEGQGDFDRAEALYKQILTMQPNHVAALCNYALLLETTQDEDAPESVARAELDKADALYARAVVLAPRNSDVLYQHALFLKNVRADFDGAEALLKEVLALAPHDATALCNYGLLLHHVRNDSAAAQELYQAGLSLPGEHVSDEERVALLFSLAALCESSLHDAVRARSLYEEALLLAPSDVSVLNSLALLEHSCFRNAAGAEVLYRRALDADADDAKVLDVLSNYALLLQHEKRYREGYALLKRAAKAAPDDADVLCNVAQFEHSKRKHFARARALYRQVLKLDGEHVRALINYGVLEGKVFADLRKAQKLFTRALEIRPSDADAREGLMQCQQVLDNGASPHDAADPGSEQVIYDPSNHLALEGS